VSEANETNNLSNLAVTAEAVDVVGPVMTNPVYPADFQDGDGAQSFSITATDAAGVSQVDLIYKGITDSESVWFTETLTAGGSDTYSISLPESTFSDDAGLMFLFRGVDNNGYSDSTEMYYTYKVYGDGQAPHLTGLPFGDDSTRYRIVSIPFVFPSGGNTMSAIFKDDLGDSLNKSNIRMYGYSGGYQELGASSGIQRGKGYWLLTLHSADIDFGETRVMTETHANPFSLSVGSGWNMVGNPYPFPIDWDDVVSANPGINLDQFTIWEGSYNDGTDGELSVFQGAFIRSDASTTIQIPMTKYGSSGGRIKEANDQDIYNSLAESSWKLNLTLDAEGFTNNIGGIGMNQAADNQGDQLDKITLPRFFTHLEMAHQDTSYLGSPSCYKKYRRNKPRIYLELRCGNQCNHGCDHHSMGQQVLRG